MSLKHLGIYFLSPFLIAIVLVTWWVTNSLADVRITPSVTIMEQYDSNAGFTDDSQTVESDYETSISPRLEIVSDNSSSQFRGSYQMNSRFYTRDSDLNYTAHSLNLGLSMPLSENTSLSIGDTFTSSMDSREVDETAAQTRRTRIISNSASLELSHQLSQKSSVAFSLSDNVSKYDDPAFLDTRTDSASLAGTYQWTPEMSTKMSYEYSIYEFDDNGVESEIKSETVELTIGYVKLFSPTLSVNIISLGGSYISSTDSGSGYTLIADANLIKNFQLSTINLSYYRGVRGASSLSTDLTINESLTAGWNYTVSRTFNVGISGSVSKNRSRPSRSVDSTTYNGGINCGWLPKSWLNVAAGYSHLRQESDTTLVDDVVGDISRDLVYINLSAAYNNWRF